MNLAQEKKVSRLVLLLVLLVHAMVLWPELSAGRIPVGDNVSHFTLIEGMVQAAEQGENPIDFWSPECAFGFSVFRAYQPMAHGLVALAYFALLKSVSLITVFVWACYLSMLAIPLAFFTMATLLEFPPLTAAAAALLSPLIAAVPGNPLGVELRSWLGFGLFAQCVATSLLLVTIGLLFQAIRKGRSKALAGALLGIAFLTHLIFGWIGALTACLLALMPDAATSRPVRFRRTLWVGTVAFFATLFQLLPLVLDGYFMNRTRFDPPEKWDSFGAVKVLQWLFTGGLMDANRVPVLSLLSFLGAGLLLWRFRKTRRLAPAELFVLIGAAFWILLFFGRPTWGPLLLLVGAPADLHLHRVNAAVQIFLLMLAAIGLAGIWREVWHRWSAAGATVATVLLLLPMVWERGKLVGNYMRSGEVTVAAYEAEQAALEPAILLVRQRGGRVYAGRTDTWGSAFKEGEAPVASILNMRQLPMVGFLSYSTALPSDLDFDEVNPAAYGLFNVRSLLAPAMPGTPPFLTPVADFGRFRVLDAPGRGYFDLVDVAAAVPITRYSFFQVSDRWMRSDWLPRKQFLWLDLKGDAPSQLPRISAGDALPQARETGEARGRVLSEDQKGQVYQAELEVVRPSFALFKMTWHPNWVISIDGKPQKTAMLSPGFLGVPVTPGRHRILCRYEPGKWRLNLALAGFALVGLIAGLEWRREAGMADERSAEPVEPAAKVPQAPRKKRGREHGRGR